MANTFALILVAVTLVTGLVWLLDHWVLVRIRAAKARQAQASAGSPLTAEAIEKLMAEPVWVDRPIGPVSRVTPHRRQRQTSMREARRAPALAMGWVYRTHRGGVGHLACSQRKPDERR